MTVSNGDLRVDCSEGSKVGLLYGRTGKRCCADTDYASGARCSCETLRRVI